MKRYLISLLLFLLTGTVSAQNNIIDRAKEAEKEMGGTDGTGGKTNDTPKDEEDNAEFSPQNTYLRIDWLTKERISTTKEFNVKIGIITSEQPQAYKIKVRKNKYNIPVTRGTRVVKKDGYNVVLNENVILKHKHNDIYALIKINGKWYRSESINITYDPNGKFEKRIALVIGNSDYNNGWEKLPNAQNDATAIAEKLKSLGFKVENTGINLNKVAFQKILSDFKRESANYDVALFYYAGHGTQDSEGKGNYLIPVDVKTANDNDLMAQCINAERMVKDDIGGKKKIIILDACRSNIAYEPQATRGGTKNGIRGRGFMEMDSPTETLILYSTGKNRSAYDGVGKHSFFAEALLNSLDESDLTLSAIIDYVTDEVKQKTAELSGGIQEPYRSGSYSSLGNFIINKSY